MIDRRDHPSLPSELARPFEVVPAENAAAPGAAAPAARPQPLPLLLRLDGQAVLVVGGGDLALEKIAALHGAGARVTVIAPEATEWVRKAHEHGLLEWNSREFREGDVLGYRLIVASTDDLGVNTAVYRSARGWQIPVHVVDGPELSDFYFGRVA